MTPYAKISDIYMSAMVDAFPPEPVKFQEESSSYADTQSGITFFRGKTWVESIENPDSFRQHDDLINLLEHEEDKRALLPAYLYLSATDEGADTEVYGLLGFLKQERICLSLSPQQRVVAVFCIAKLLTSENIMLEGDLSRILENLLRVK